jgi:erythromycin esterase-like protein
MDRVAALINRSERLARKFFEGPLSRRFRHTVAVAERAQWLAARLLAPQRAELVVAAAWLHDVGYAPDLVDTGFHPIDGARYAARAGLPSALVGLIAHHTGAVFEARERDLAAQLHYPVPDTVELAILSCADLCAAPDGAPTDPERRLDDVLARYPSDHPVHRAVRQSGPQLVAQAGLVLAAADAMDAASTVFPLPDWSQPDVARVMS